MLLSAKVLLSEAETNVPGPWVSRVGGWMYFKAGLALCVIKWNRWDPPWAHTARNPPRVMQLHYVHTNIFLWPWTRFVRSNIVQ